MWVLLNHGLSFRAELDAQKVKYVADPKKASEILNKNFDHSIDNPVDCLIDGSRPAVYLAEKHVRPVTFGDAIVSTTTLSSIVLSSLAEGFAFPRSQQLIEDEKLQVALELYAASFTEISNNAKFLTLIMTSKR